MKTRISDGNGKVGRIPNISLTPGRTCSAEACRTCLSHGCYALKSYRMYPSVRRSWDANTGLATQATTKQGGTQNGKSKSNLYLQNLRRHV